MPDATQNRGPVHALDAGRYYAEIVDGIPMIFRADTAGAVTHIETMEGCIDCPHPDYCAGMGKCERSD